MKKIQKTLAAILFTTMMVALFSACNKSDEAGENKLVGTWTEKNTLFTDILTLKENGEFSFQSHLPFLNGSGNYKVQITTAPNTDPLKPHNEDVQYMEILILNFSGRGSETLKIISLTSDKLELSDRYDNLFHFRK
ncbi:MAG: hypothetical protein IJQ59_09810 [Bacteroidaceae bacterium]|nr:hypothetical protein [Bacteroidaceae bacterium]